MHKSLHKNQTRFLTGTQAELPNSLMTWEMHKLVAGEPFRSTVAKSGRVVPNVSAICSLFALGIGCVWSQENLDAERLEQLEARVGAVEVRVDNVFDLSDPKEDKKLYRWANRAHITTRNSTVEDILLVAPGDDFSARLLEESARVLRSRGFVAEAHMVPVSYDETTNEVTVEAYVKDAWSLTPEIKLSREGGQNEYGLGFTEENLLGLGKEFTIAYESEVDRDSRLAAYTDPNVKGTRTRFNVEFADLSDGERQAFGVERPFFALDSRWSVGSSFLNDKRVESMYGLGEVIERFAHDTRDFSVRGGVSRGLVNGRAIRWLFGMNSENDEFFPLLADPGTQLLPANRKLVFPWIGFQLIEDDFREMSELNDIGRTEDVPLGLDITVQLGFATESFGSDRRATILRASAHKGWELNNGDRLLLFDAIVSARHEQSSVRNALITSNLRYFRRNFEKHLFSINLTTVFGKRLDLENQILLGGDSALRGYPLRYQSGERSATLTFEQRFFTDWYPMRLLRVGYAAFLDVGRVWGDNPRGIPNFGTLYDVGIGLRITSPRSTGDSVIHIDLSFPVNAKDQEIDSVQLSVERKSSL